MRFVPFQIEISRRLSGHWRWSVPKRMRNKERSLLSARRVRFAAWSAVAQFSEDIIIIEI